MKNETEDLELRKKIKAIFSLLDDNRGNSEEIIKKLRSLDPNWREILKENKRLEPTSAEKEIQRKKFLFRKKIEGKVCRKKMGNNTFLEKVFSFEKKTLTYMKQEIFDPSLIENFKKIDCSSYERCLNRAAILGWVGFSCKNCAEFS